MDNAERRELTLSDLLLNHWAGPGVNPWGDLSLLIAVFLLVQLCQAADNLPERRREEAVTPRFGLTQIYQQNVHGGNSRAGRYTGSYALETEIDLDTLLGACGAGFYVLVEGGWPEAGGIDATAIGSYFGVNADAIETEWGELSELWFEQALADGHLMTRVGKLDLTGTFRCRGCDTGFDGNKYANDETTQFLNGALVNNPTIPFPDRTFGAAFFASPSERWHLGCAIAARDDEGASWGSAYGGLFAIVEANFLPEQKWCDRTVTAHYRAGIWNASDGGRDSSDAGQRGAYLSISQPVWPVNGRSDGDGGLSAFARAGWTDGSGAELASFWSLGLQYQGLWAVDDVIGLATAHGTFVHTADSEVPVSSETLWELYYNATITPEIMVSPSVQYVADPGGDTPSKDALAVGLRLQINLE